MHKLEKYIYDKVKHNYRLKKLVVDLYQRTCSIVPVTRAKSDYKIITREGYFFGFHDKCPWSSDNKMLLSHKYSIPLRLPKPGDAINVGFFIGSDFQEYQILGTTKAWNWQTGSMLQWIGSSFQILYNDYEDGKNMAKIVSSSGQLIKKLPLPVAALSSDGLHALNYDFERLRPCAPAYAYASVTAVEDSAPVPKSSGINLIEIESSKVTKLFSVADVARMNPQPSMAHAYHYFTHCLFSPSNERFVFFHRWVNKYSRTWTRMISSDLMGKDIYIFPTSGMVSHIAWRDGETVLAYANTKEFGDKYYLFQDQTGHFSTIGEKCFTSDGHPQFSSDKRWIVTDTYPNRFRVQSLLIYDTNEKKLYNIANLRSPFKYKYDLRCDLHPRWNRDSSMICFDSAHNGIRSLSTISLDNLSETSRECVY